jgi:hypothetical protein
MGAVMFCCAGFVDRLAGRTALSGFASRGIVRQSARAIQVALAIGTLGFGLATSANAQSGSGRDPYGFLTNSSYCWVEEVRISQDPIRGWQRSIQPGEGSGPKHNSSDLLGRYGSGTASADGHFIRSGDGSSRLRRVPCPETTRPAFQSWSGPFVGLQVTGSTSRVITNEFLTGTDIRSTSLVDHGTGFGGGVNFGWNWQPINATSLIGVVIDVNGVHEPVQHDFFGGAYIGSVVNFSASAQVRGGVLVTPNVLLFGQGGISVSNQQLKIDFGGPETNESKTIPGLTLGFGGEWKLHPFDFAAPTISRSLVTPSLFATYEHTWWDTAKLTMPAASPGFDYSWQRQSDTLKFGARINWGDGH